MADLERGISGNNFDATARPMPTVEGPVHDWDIPLLDGARVREVSTLPNETGPELNVGNWAYGNPFANNRPEGSVIFKSSNPFTQMVRFDERLPDIRNKNTK